MNSSQTFLEIGENDLMAAKCLYENEFYSQAVFYLQQFIEKIFKSLGASGEKYSLDQLKRNIGHNPLRILSDCLGITLAAARKKQETAPEDSIEGQIAMQELELLGEIKNASIFYEQRRELENVSKGELIAFLTHFRDENEEAEFQRHVSTFMTEKYEQIIDLLVSSYDENIEKVTVKRILMAYKEHIASILDAFSLLTIMALIFPPVCVEDTRYPSDDESPMEKYSKVNPIISSFPFLLESGNIALEKLKSIYSDLRQLEL